MMLLQIQLSATEDELMRRKDAADLIIQQKAVESNLADKLTTQNAALRGEVEGLRGKLKQMWQYSKEMEAALDDRDLQLKQLDEEESHSETQIAQLKNELHAAQRALASASERASLAEESLKQKAALASERAQMQADMQHNYQDLAKMALETGSAANARLLGEAQTQLVAERAAKVAAEATAAAAVARAEHLEKTIAALESQLKLKGQRVAHLEEHLQQREAATPARAVHAALDAVGEFVSQLDNSPDDGSEMMMPAKGMHPRKPALSMMMMGDKTKGKNNSSGGGVKKVVGGAQKKKIKIGLTKLSSVCEEEEDEDEGEQHVGVVQTKTKGRGRKLKNDDDEENENEIKIDGDVAARVARAAADGKRKRNTITTATIDEEEDDDEEVLPKKKNRGVGGGEQKTTTKQHTTAKFNLRKVWEGGDAEPTHNDATTAEAPQQKNQSQKERGKENNSTTTTNEAAMPPLPPFGKLHKRPLEALNPGTVAAAANQVRAAAVLLPPLKPAAVRPLLGISGKRKLLGVSNSAALNDGLTVNAFYKKGASTTAPKLL